MTPAEALIAEIESQYQAQKDAHESMGIKLQDVAKNIPVYLSIALLKRIFDDST